MKRDHKMLLVLLVVWFILAAVFMTAHKARADANLSTQVSNNNFLGIGSSDDGTQNVNSHISAMGIPCLVNPEYNGPVFTDHKIQKEILDFLLAAPGLHPFRIIKVTGGFTQNVTQTGSKCMREKPLPKQNRVFVSKRTKDFSKRVYKIVGIIDTYSDGSDDEDLMRCFDQAVLDSGRMGANALIILKIDFMTDVNSKTVGLGGSGANSSLHGGKVSSVYGFALGYAQSTAKPRTNPYIHGVALYIEGLE